MVNNGLFQMYVLLILFTTHVLGLFHFKKLEIELQARLAENEKSEDLWIEQKLDNFHPQDTRKWMQVFQFLNTLI